MHVLITGANGFVGQALAARLERERALGGRAIDALTLIDIRFTTPATGLARQLVGEILVADFSRRHWIDGLSLRLPGVLARPPTRTGQASAFLSDIIRELAAGHTFTAPMSPQATTWASSIHNIVENLLQGATV